MAFLLLTKPQYEDSPVEALGYTKSKEAAKILRRQIAKENLENFKLNEDLDMHSIKYNIKTIRANFAAILGALLKHNPVDATALAAKAHLDSGGDITHHSEYYARNPNQINRVDKILFDALQLSLREDYSVVEDYYPTNKSHISIIKIKRLKDPTLID